MRDLRDLKVMIQDVKRPLPKAGLGGGGGGGGSLESCSEIAGGVAYDA